MTMTLQEKLRSRRFVITAEVTPPVSADREELFAKASGPSRVVFELESKDGTTAVVQSQRKIRVTSDLISALERICGDEGIQRIS